MSASTQILQVPSHYQFLPEVHNLFDVLEKPAVDVGEHADVVHAEASTAIAFLEPAEYRDVEIACTLRANLHATGVVTIRIGGLLEGELHGGHLVVEDGGGLRGVLEITRK
jgi:hypothetical protein